MEYNNNLFVLQLYGINEFENWIGYVGYFLFIPGSPPFMILWFGS